MCPLSRREHDCDRRRDLLQDVLAIAFTERVRGQLSLAPPVVMNDQGVNFGERLRSPRYLWGGSPKTKQLVRVGRQDLPGRLTTIRRPQQPASGRPIELSAG